MNMKPYNTRHSGRYNIPGQFVPAAENQQQQQYQQQQQQPLFPSSQNPRKNFNQNLQVVQQTDVDMKVETPSPAGGTTADGTQRPSWMKPKLPGVKKISNKERRRRQNENLRKLLTPKNALMVLNEMMPSEQLASQFKVEQESPFPGGEFYGVRQHNFCAGLTLDGNMYKGYGENKLTARNAAAEQAIRDLILKKMAKVQQSDGASSAGGSQNGDEPMADEEVLPMIQLASFALHKLFSEWEYQGHKVPQLKPSHTSTSDSNAADGSEAAFGNQTSEGTPAKQKPPKKPKELPANASSMHPCMLLTYMRPQLTYSTMNVDGDRPQNIMYTLGVEVDGTTYVGKAPNKKEARRQAAMAACQALFNVKFEENAYASTPVAATT